MNKLVWRQDPKPVMLCATTVQDLRLLVPRLTRPRATVLTFTHSVTVHLNSEIISLFKKLRDAEIEFKTSFLTRIAFIKASLQYCLEAIAMSA